jgi:hypothetical protein
MLGRSVRHGRPNVGVATERSGSERWRQVSNRRAEVVSFAPSRTPTTLATSRRCTRRPVWRGHGHAVARRAACRMPAHGHGPELLRCWLAVECERLLGLVERFGTTPARPLLGCS